MKYREENETAVNTFSIGAHARTRAPANLCAPCRTRGINASLQRADGACSVQHRCEHPLEIWYSGLHRMTLRAHETNTGLGSRGSEAFMTAVKKVPRMPATFALSGDARSTHGSCVNYNIFCSNVFTYVHDRLILITVTCAPCPLHDHNTSCPIISIYRTNCLFLYHGYQADLLNAICTGYLHLNLDACPWSLLAIALTCDIDTLGFFRAMKLRYDYQYGFGNHFATECVPGALPVGQNNPQKCAYGLYAEQLSGTAFTAPRSANQRTWMYRVRPSVDHGACQRVSFAERAPGLGFRGQIATPERLRWQPRDDAAPDRTAAADADTDTDTDFLRGLFRIGENGLPEDRNGLSIYSYWCNTSMDGEAFYNADGDLLILPQQGELVLQTELGMLEVPAGHVAVVPRGIRFAARVVPMSDTTSTSRGFVLEVYDRHFELPDLGPIGANGCAAPRDFRYPLAYVDRDTLQSSWRIWAKFQNQIFMYETDHSVFDVVAWHGNYAPFAYDLDRFCPVNAVRFDHMDPSIFTVLTCRSDEPGVALADFVIFPPRWNVQEHTFRPPYFHRNCMTEFMMNLAGEYDAKSAAGFPPGACSLHSIMSAHGPDLESFARAATEQLRPKRLPDSTLAAMFETSRMLRITKEALELLPLDRTYTSCWRDFPPATIPSS